MVVTRTRPSPIARRWRIGSGPNAEKSVQATARCFSVPSTRDVQLGDAAEQHEHPLAGLDAEIGEDVGEPVRLVARGRRR